MGYEINWHTNPGAPVLRHPLYEKYRSTDLGSIDKLSVKADLRLVIMDVDSAPVVAYLSWLLRCLDLVAEVTPP